MVLFVPAVVVYDVGYPILNRWNLDLGRGVVFPDMGKEQDDQARHAKYREEEFGLQQRDPGPASQETFVDRYEQELYQHGPACQLPRPLQC